MQKMWLTILYSFRWKKFIELIFIVNYVIQRLFDWWIIHFEFKNLRPSASKPDGVPFWLRFTNWLFSENFTVSLCSERTTTRRAMLIAKNIQARLTNDVISLNPFWALCVWSDSILFSNLLLLVGIFLSFTWFIVTSCVLSKNNLSVIDYILFNFSRKSFKNGFIWISWLKINGTQQNKVTQQNT